MDSDSDHCPYGSEVTKEETKIPVLEPRFECPICLNCLKEPYLTTCGHRFCQDCILEWLRKKNRRCPVDGNTIEEKDLFPDNYTRREITQQTVQCSFPDCDSVTPLLDIEKHVAEIHENNALSNLHLNGVDKLAKEADSWEAPPKHPKNCQNQLIMSMFERIVQLEQKSRQQEFQLASAISTINDMNDKREKFMGMLPLKICNGVHVWNVKNIREKLNFMTKDTSEMFYSDGFYTSYTGYKFCARLNISPNNNNYFSLLVHLMKSENDDVLPWPFNGRISFTFLHPTAPENSLREVMCTKRGLKAFEKPTTNICPRAFGYTEFAPVCDIINNGYIYENGSVNIRIEIICV